MTFPRKLLIAGEQVVLELRPHWIGVALPAVVALAGTAVAIWLTTAVFHDGTAALIIWALWLVGMLIYPVRRLVWWRTSNFVVTTSRVIHREGFVAKRSMEIPLDKINDVRFEQGVFDRVVGAGTLIIQSASESGRNEFSFIRHPEQVQRTIYQETEAAGGRQAQRASATPASPVNVQPPANVPHPGAPSATTELERLADLRARGVLTEEEFQAQKAKILRG
jgi:uncharacterized membrane protein YdbT with pleckstrin-like domain